LVFKEHGVVLYLPKKLYIAWIKLQADKGLGRSFAGLLPFVEGMYSLEYITKDVYEEYFYKYSVPLSPKFEVLLSEEERKQKDFLEGKNRQFRGQFEQWNDHLELKWRQNVLAEAKKYPNLEYAKRILEEMG
jgi:hypothetical protein